MITISTTFFAYFQRPPVKKNKSLKPEHINSQFGHCLCDCFFLVICCCCTQALNDGHMGNMSAFIVALCQIFTSSKILNGSIGQAIDDDSDHHHHHTLRLPLACHTTEHHWWYGITSQKGSTLMCWWFGSCARTAILQWTVSFSVTNN